MARTTPTVWEVGWGAQAYAEVQFAGSTTAAIRLDSPQWFAWLEAATTARFAYPIYDPQVGYIRGWMTVRKERRARGSRYWVAYRRVGGTLRKVYLGRAARVTRTQLAATAAQFLAGLGGPGRPRGGGPAHPGPQATPGWS